VTLAHPDANMYGARFRREQQQGRSKRSVAPHCAAALTSRMPREGNWSRRVAVRHVSRKVPKERFLSPSAGKQLGATRYSGDQQVERVRLRDRTTFRKPSKQPIDCFFVHFCNAAGRPCSNNAWQEILIEFPLQR